MSGTRFKRYGIYSNFFHSTCRRCANAGVRVAEIDALAESPWSPWNCHLSLVMRGRTYARTHMRISRWVRAWVICWSVYIDRPSHAVRAVGSSLDDVLGAV